MWGRLPLYAVAGSRRAQCIQGRWDWRRVHPLLFRIGSSSGCGFIHSSSTKRMSMLSEEENTRQDSSLHQVNEATSKIKSLETLASVMKDVEAEINLSPSHQYLSSGNMNTTVLGFGINDLDFAKISPYYKVWHHMLMCCYSVAYQKRFPKYVGSTVCEEWCRLSNFRAWMVTQDGHWEEKKQQLSKGILVHGSKVFSPETCIFVPHAINNLLSRSAAKSADELPRGVTRDQRGGKYKAELNKYGIHKYL